MMCDECRMVSASPLRKVSDMTDEELLELWRAGELRVTQLSDRQQRIILKHFDDDEDGEES
jgi:hypothetical protein